MRLADALMQRSEMNKKLASLKERMKGNCLVQEGDEPGEDPQSLLNESFRIVQELQGLVCRINRTNMTVNLANGKTMMEAIAERDRVTAQHHLLKEAATACRIENNYYSNSEIKWRPVLKVAELEKQADDLSKKIRELNSAIQEVNWTHELLEE